MAIKTSAKRNLKIRKTLFASTLVFICISLVYATYQQKKEWVVPQEAKIRKNPLPPSEAGLKTAREVYLDECAKCHGESGRGDGPEAMMHEPSPADLTDAKRMSAVTDGEIFYQISEGKRPMPSFKNRMTEDQRWQLVLLVRSFAQPATVPEKKPEASDMKSSVGHKP